MSAGADALTDRHVLVTGAGGRIGRAVVAELSAAGARVAALDLAAPEGTGAATAVAADVADQRAVRAAFTEAERVLGPVHGVVNAHGVFPNLPVREMTVEEWDRVFAVNVRGVMLTTREAFDRWIARSTPGAIVTLSSGAARSARAGGGHYCSSKAAVEMLTQVSAIEGGPHGIRVNAVAPGLVLDEVTTRDTPDLPGYFEQTLRATPLRRTGDPAEVARACRFLLSDASSWTTGAVLDVSGGSHCGRPAAPLTRDLR
jgi:NAD(P)-dependent dehydrogenase (short-subunit alcohol dehydrogenase family)